MLRLHWKKDIYGTIDKFSKSLDDLIESYQCKFPDFDICTLVE